MCAALRFSSVVVVLLAVVFAAQAQRSTDQEVVLPDESVLLDVLQRSNPHDVEKQLEILETLRQLTEMSREKAIKFPETYKELVRFIEVRKPDDENYTGSLAVSSHLDQYPAMLALWYGGEDVLPLLTDVLVTEPETSKKYSLSLWEIIYLKQIDFKATYSYLIDRTDASASFREQDRLKLAAGKVKACMLPTPCSGP